MLRSALITCHGIALFLYLAGGIGTVSSLHPPKMEAYDIHYEN